MNKSASKIAMARARARRAALGGAAVTAPAVETEQEAAPAPEDPFEQALEFAVETAPEDAPDVAVEAAPLRRSPPVLMLVVDEEEEVEFCSSAPQTLECVDPPPAANDADLDAPDEEPPFDAPDLAELLAGDEEAEEVEEASFDLIAEDDEEPPFDPIDVEELTPPTLSVPLPAKEELVLTPAHESRGAQLGPVRNARPEGARDQPAPAIRVYLSWDRPEAGEFFQRVAADPRLARTETIISRGGLDGAAVFCTAHERPDLVVVDSTLRGAPMLASLDRLMRAAGGHTKVIVLGAVNDVTLLRELAQRGVNEYMMWPLAAADVAGAACALFADTDKSRVIAVVGARGGIGASTIAHNIAWSIAERLRVRATLVDLDLPFGAAAFNFKLEPLRSLGDVLDANESASDVALERVGIQRTERLTILPAPANPRRSADLEAETATALIAAARRLSSYVVLDLPHLWDPWVKDVLVRADEVVLVSCPDIASLRNTDNIAKKLKDERKTDPTVVLSMAGVPKRPEVPIKEFAEALGIAPECVFAFEPNVFGAAALTGQMLGEIAPDSKAAAQIDQLASLLTGRDPIDVLPEPRVFEEPLPAIEPEAADPFEHALVNQYALEDHEPVVTDEPPEAQSEDLAPLDLLELTPLEAAYLARARAAALAELDAIETVRAPRAPLLPQLRIGPFASALMGFAVTLLAAGVLFFKSLETSPAPAAARVTAVQAAPPAPPPPPTPQQMAAAYEAAVLLFEQEGGAQAAVAQLQRLADSGFVMAQYRLAKVYEQGQGVTADLAHARQWTERAAAGGNRAAMHDLGVYFATGEDGAVRDEAAAFRWFMQAAELGDADSQFNLGVLHEQGRGVEASVAEALFWFMLAAQQGDDAAAERAAALEAALTPFELEQAAARVAAFQPLPLNAFANGEFAPVAQAQDGEPPRAVQPDGDAPA